MSSSTEEQHFDSIGDPVGTGPLSYEALVLEADAQRTRADKLRDIADEVFHTGELPHVRLHDSFFEQHQGERST